MQAPAGFEKWNPALRGAYRKGYEAAIAGLCSSACPYQDKRKDDGKLTWSRSFIAAWRDGWLAGEEQRKQDAITAFYTEGKHLGRRPSTWVR